MSVPGRHLHVVDAETGEVFTEGCPGCAVKDDIIKGHESTIRSWEVKYANLARDKEAEAREHQLWPRALRIVKAWRVLCNHPRASFGAAEFDLIRPFLQDKQYGQDADARELMCLRAVAGASFDAFTTRRKNGSLKRHDGLDLIFRSRSKFEEMANRAPRDWRERLPEGVADAA